MATYKYQQNYYEGASAGYVKYNVTPDFGAALCVGETFEVTGKFYSGDAKCYGLIVQASTGTDGYTRELGRVVKTVAKGGSATFTVQCTVTQALADDAASRGFEALLGFLLSSSASFDAGTETVTNAAQKLSCLKSRQAPSVTGVTFSDGSGALAHFGGAVSGKSKLSAALTLTLDPLDSTATLAAVKLQFGTHTISVGADKISGSTVQLGTPDFDGAFTTYTLTATDSKGKSGSYTGGAFTIYAYQAPKLEALADTELAERYEVGLADDGSEIVSLSDAGTYLWANFEAEITAINGANAWTIKRAFAEVGYDLPTATTVYSGTDGETILKQADQTVFPRTLTFDASKRYTVELTLADYFESKTLRFEVDKAGGYFNIERYGVAAGMRSTGTKEAPKFESAYPFYAYAGIEGVSNYSTEEVKTGGTWIDGKPIYRTLVTASGSLANNTVVTTKSFSNVDTLIRLSGAVLRSDGVKMAIPVYSGDAYFVSCEIDASGALKLYKGTSITTAFVAVLLEYTKSGGSGGGEVEKVSRPAAAMTANSSQNCIASASSEYSASYAAWKAFDGVNNSAYGWASSTSDSNKWIQLQMDVALKNIVVTIANRSRDSLVNGMTAGTIQGSNDGTAWTTLCTISGRNGTKSKSKTTHELKNDTAYKYLRVNITSSANNSYAAIGEITIEGEKEVEESA